MPLISEMRHPNGFDFQTERLIALRRDVHEETWPEIAEHPQVKTLRGEKPRPRHVADTYHKFDAKRGRCRTRYHKCGRTTTKATPEAVKFLIRKLIALRKTCVCTASLLQQCLATEMKIKISQSYVQKILKENGYKWMPKQHKRL